MTISPTQQNAHSAVRDFLLAVLPAGTPIILAQGNRVPEPLAGDFVVMTPLRMERIETNVDSAQDTRFTGSIAGGILTVASVTLGTLQQGLTVFGAGVLANTVLGRQLTGPAGGTGTYNVSNNQTVPLEVMAVGGKVALLKSRETIQLDFHGAVATDAGDMAATVSALWRDEFATSFFAGLSPPLNSVTPLYADDPRQIPFLNAEQQYEWRWTLDAMIQLNQVVVIPQQYADSLAVVLQPVF
jgi:hypothetical protein